MAIDYNTYLDGDMQNRHFLDKNVQDQYPLVGLSPLEEKAAKELLNKHFGNKDFNISRAEGIVKTSEMKFLTESEFKRYSRLVRLWVTIDDSQIPFYLERTPTQLTENPKKNHTIMEKVINDINPWLTYFDPYKASKKEGPWYFILTNRPFLRKEKLDSQYSKIYKHLILPNSPYLPPKLDKYMDAILSNAINEIKNTPREDIVFEIKNYINIPLGDVCFNSYGLIEIYHRTSPIK